MINWTVKEFASCLKTIHVPARDVCQGDIVLVDGQPWGVARVGKTRGLYFIYDRDENGTGAWKPDQLVKILPRESLRDGAVK